MKMKQRVITLCVKANKTGSETFDMLHIAYGDDTLSRSRTFEWHRRFKAGRKSTEDDQCVGDQNHQKLGKTSKLSKEKILSDRRLIIREIAMFKFTQTCWKPTERIQILLGTSLRVTKAA